MNTVQKTQNTQNNLENLLTTDCLKWVEERYLKKYNSFDMAVNGYCKLKKFAPDGNIWESGQAITEQEHYVMRLVTQYYLTQAFEAMLIDLDDENVKEDLSTGNIGTPGRVSKVWVGASFDDTVELGSGRWNQCPRIATFPNTNIGKSIPITKRVEVVSSCSHHFLPFSTQFREDSYAIVSYIPAKVVLGISKLDKVVSHVSRSFHLQENLTYNIYKKISEVAETDSVYVKLVNLAHTCSTLRSNGNSESAFSSEYYGGAFEDPELRKQVDRSVR